MSRPGTTGPTERLLLAACGVDPERRTRRLGELDLGAVEWPRLLELARRNRIVPLLHHALRAAGLEDVLFREAPAFPDFLRHHQLRNLFLYRELVELARTLVETGIEVLPYKGPLLSLSLYGDVGLRQFYDLDLVVRRADLARATERFQRRGYRLLDEGVDFANLPEADCELHFRPRSGDPLVELHWDVLPARQGFGFRMDDLWERLVPARLEDLAVSTFGPEDELLVLSFHAGEKHRWNRLQMVADVARLLDVHRDLDWDAVGRRARAVGRAGLVLQGVLLAWALLDAPLDEAVLRRALARPDVRTAAALAMGRQLRLDSGLPTYDAWRAHGELLEERARERGEAVPRGSGFLGYLRAAATPEWTDRRALALPPALSLFYYVYRPWRLWRKHRTGLFRRI